MKQCIPNVATAADWVALFTLSLTFVTGSGNGAQLCAPWTARTDDLVEGDEDFNLILALVSSSFNLGNAATNVVILVCFSCQIIPQC